MSRLASALLLASVPIVYVVASRTTGDHRVDGSVLAALLVTIGGGALVGLALRARQERPGAGSLARPTTYLSIAAVQTVLGIVQLVEGIVWLGVLFISAALLQLVTFEQERRKHGFGRPRSTAARAKPDPLRNLARGDEPGERRRPRGHLPDRRCQEHAAEHDPSCPRERLRESTSADEATNGSDLVLVVPVPLTMHDAGASVNRKNGRMADRDAAWRTTAALMGAFTLLAIGLSLFDDPPLVYVCVTVVAFVASVVGIAHFVRVWWMTR